MKSAAALAKQARLLAGYTRAELARAAEVSPSTVGRIESGDLDPTWTVLGKVLGAAGFTLGDTLTSLGDGAVVDAATNALSATPEPRDDAWTRSWSRAGLLDESGRAKDLSRVAAIAGLASEIPARRGTRTYLLEATVVQTLNALEEAGANPVATGPVSFDDSDPSGVVIYVDDPDGLLLKSPEPYRPTLTAMKRPAKLDFFSGAAGINVASLERALVDSFASGGRVADRADAYAARLAAAR